MNPVPIVAFQASAEVYGYILLQIFRLPQAWLLYVQHLSPDHKSFTVFII
jgi:hypothetical protein